ncbi:MAG: hypothetical protein H6618_03690 [Deltaproteobacteria bacterium]|nr:hypothetical protein [Deltaproteobacteria bacterium]
MASDKQLQSLIQQAITEKFSVFLSCTEVPVTFESRVVRMDGKTISLLNTVTPDFIRQVSKSSSFSIQIGNQKILTDQILTDGKYIMFPVPEASPGKNLRTEERVLFSDPDTCYCEILNPVDQQTILRKPILDLSRSGVSIRNDKETLLFTPGIIFQKIDIYVKNKKNDTFSGKVVYQRKLINIKGYASVQVGLKFI